MMEILNKITKDSSGGQRSILRKVLMMRGAELVSLPKVKGWVD